jgi:hypothetical protein
MNEIVDKINKTDSIFKVDSFGSDSKLRNGFYLFFISGL